MIKKWLVWGGIAFIIFMVVWRPSACIDVIRTLGQTLIDASNWLWS